MGLYSVLLTLLFAGILLGILNASFQRVYRLVLDLIPHSVDIGAFITTYLFETFNSMVVVIVAYSVISVTVTIVYTHRLVGPTVAFRRQIKEIRRGNYAARIRLRKGDAFPEVAEELNQLAAELEARQDAAAAEK